MARPDPRGATDGQSKAEILEALRKKLAPTAPKPRTEGRPSLTTGWAAVDDLLGGGLPRGAVVEACGAAGRMSLACTALAGATAAGHLAALVDAPGALDPAALRDAGADLERVLWIRPKPELGEALRCADVLLDGDHFPLVVLYTVGAAGRVNTAAWQRLQQRAARAGAAVLLIGERPLAGSFTAATLHLQRGGAAFRRVPGRRLLLMGQDLQVRLGRARWEGAGAEAQVRLQR